MKTFSFLTFLLLLLFAMDKNRPKETDEPEPAVRFTQDLCQMALRQTSSNIS